MREVDHAPKSLERVRAFVNTLDVEEGTDELGDPRAAGAWLLERGLLRTGGAGVDATGHARVLALREALRALLLANNAREPGPPDAWRTVNSAADRASFELCFGDDGPTLRAAGAGVDAALATLLIEVEEAMQEGTWQRLKVCPADDCLWAFYDRSRNRSATWCEMGECGNRNKARAWRERRRRANQ